MKSKLWLFLFTLIMHSSLFGQNTLNYQGFIRDNANKVVAKKAVSIRISILEGSAGGTAVYTELQKPSTDANGFISIEIGSESDFDLIDWGAKNYFLKTEIDPLGGNSFSISGTTPILKVPLALHANVADKLKDGIVEKDPAFTGSPAKNITANNITQWNSAFAWGDHSQAGYLKTFTESDPQFNASVAKDVQSTDVTNWNAAFAWGDHSQAGYLTTFSESDPQFNASVAKDVQSTDVTNWNAAFAWGDHSRAGYLTTFSESDPLFNASAAKDVQSTDVTNWNAAFAWGDHSQAGYSLDNHVHAEATPTQSGLLSGSDKSKLDALASASANSGATYRWATFQTYDQTNGWVAGNSAALFGGVNPSNWTDASAIAAHMSSDKEVLRTLYTQKGYAKKNAMILNENWFSYSSTNGKVVTALFRIKNNTSSAIAWNPHFYYSAYYGWSERASVALNGGNMMTADSPGFSTTLSLSIPAGRTSTVIFVSTSSAPQSGTSLRNCQLIFADNSLQLPDGLTYVDDLDVATGGWEQ